MFTPQWKGWTNYFRYVYFRFHHWSPVSQCFQWKSWVEAGTIKPVQITSKAPPNKLEESNCSRDRKPNVKPVFHKDTQTILKRWRTSIWSLCVQTKCKQHMWRFALFGTICTIYKTWKTLLHGRFSRFFNCTDGSNLRKRHILLTTALSCACGILVTIHALPISRSILSNSSLFNERIWEMKQLSRCADGQMRLCSWWKMRVFSVNFSTSFTFSNVPKIHNQSKYYAHSM